MAKPLTSPQPSSSVANFLEPSVGAAALAKVEHVSPPIAATPIVTQLPPARLNVVRLPRRYVLRQFKWPSDTDETLQRLVAVFSEAVGTDLKMTEVLCAIMKGIESALPEIAREAGSMGPMQRPKNDPNNDRRKEEFLTEIAKRFVAGMRAASVLE